MPEEKEKVVETTQPPAEKPVEQPKAETVEDKVEESVEVLKRQLQNKSEEAARLHKKVEKFEADEAERKKAAMSETERLQAELQEAKRKADELATKQSQRDAAEKVGLPLVFADRLKGGTPEEMEADAKALLESMPKAKVAATRPASPSGSTEKGPNDEDRRNFLWG